MNVTESDARGEGAIERFESSYKEAHGYIAATICLFGMAMNTCNIYILTRKNMKNSPTNILLTALATCDFMTEVVYLPFAVYFYIQTDTDPLYKHHHTAWIYYAIISLDITHVTHTAALWLTVSLATFRFIYVCHHTKAVILCSTRRAYMTICLVVIISLLFCTPGFLCYGVVEVTLAGNQTVTWMGETQLCQYQHGALKLVAHLAFGGVIKCCACTLLSYLTIRLLISLQQAKRRRQNLMKNSKSCDKKSEHGRTTVMLIAVALCFVIAEFPQGVMVVMASLDKKIFNNVYVYLADFLDDVVLLNSSVNFILYTTMSNKFRETFHSKLIQPLAKLTGIKYLRRHKSSLYRTAAQDNGSATASSGQDRPLINTHNSKEKRKEDEHQIPNDSEIRRIERPDSMTNIITMSTEQESETETQ